MTPGELGAAIERLPGVLAATVFSDSPTGTRVYLAVAPDADTDAVRDTVLGLLRDHGHAIDPGRVHVGTAPRTPRPVSPVPSMTLDGLDIHRADNRVDCAVQLRVDGRVLSGSAREPDTPHGRAQAAARATLAAAENADPDLRLGLHGVREHDLFGVPAVALLIEASVGRSHLQLPGTATIDRSIEHAAALATLQALRGWTL